MNVPILPTKRGRPKTRDKEFLLDSAMHAYWKDDTASVSINAICQIANVSKPSLYRDFGSEDGLTAAVLERYAQMILSTVSTMLTSPMDFHEKLESLIDFACDNSQLDNGCLFVKMRAARSRFGERTQTIITIIESDTIEIYTQFFKNSAAKAQWESKIPPELAALYLHEQLGLAISQRATNHDQKSIRELLVLALSVISK